MLRSLSSFTLVLFSCFVLHAQIGGDNVYEFVNLPPSARITASGGNLIVIKDDDLNLAMQNPSLLNPKMHKQFSVSSVIFPGKINYGYVTFAKDYENIATFHTSMQYIAYGKFQEADVTGQINGEFGASEFSATLGGGRQYEKYSYGANFKFIYSQLKDYSSVGMALDFAATFHDTAKLFTAALVIRNVGGQLKPYRSDHRENLPFEIQAGFSKKLGKAPFRINVTAHNLQTANIRYDDGSNDNVNILSVDSTQQTEEKKYIFDKIMRHFIISTELYFGKVITVRLGYNHLRRQEMKVATKGGLTGVSFGFGVKVKKFRIDYGMAKHHLGGTSNHFSITTNLSKVVSNNLVKSPNE